MNSIVRFLREAEEALLEGRFDDVYWGIDFSLSVIDEARFNPRYQDDDILWCDEVFENDSWDSEGLCYCFKSNPNYEAAYNTLTRGRLENYTDLAERLYKLFKLEPVMNILNRSCFKSEAKYSGEHVMRLIYGVINKSLVVRKSARLKEGDTALIDGIEYIRLGDELVSEHSNFTYSLDTGEDDEPELFLTRNIFAEETNGGNKWLKPSKLFT